MNERERRFCEEYLVDLCAARAALRAGYAPATARNASTWIKPEHPTKPQLRAQIDRLMAERALRTQVSGDRVVRGLARIAFEDEGASPGDGAPGGEDGDAKPRRGAGGVRVQDKLRALELLGKHLGLFAGEAGAPQAMPVIIDDAGEERRDGEGQADAQ